MAAQGRGRRSTLHFGFGHGPSVCPGKHLGQLEVGLVVGAFVKVFRFKTENRRQSRQGRRFHQTAGRHPG